MWYVNVIENKKVIAKSNGKKTFADAWIYKIAIEPSHKKKGRKVTVTFEEMLDDEI